MIKNKIKQSKITLGRKLWFKFEETLSKGTISIIFWLSIITILMSFFFGILVIVLNIKPLYKQEEYSFIEAFWQSFLHIIDTGTICADQTWSYRIIALFSTLLGVFIFSALISVLTSGLEKTFNNIRKGKSEVIIKDYTLVLGWSPTIYKIISELVLANANHKGRSIVILSQKDKIEMEDEIQARINQNEIIYQTYLKDKKSKIKYHKTKVLCRKGNPIDLNDLRMVNPDKARSIIILPTDDVNSDTNVIKCILALDSLKVKEQIVTEIRSTNNRNAIEFCFKQNDIQNKIFVPSINWLSKITAQTSRQSGYSTILTELLNYESNEIYLIDVTNEIIGKSFETLLVSCSTSIILGVFKKNIDESGFTDKFDFSRDFNNLILNPLAKCKPNSSNRIIEKGDKLIVLQLDDFNPDFNPEYFNFKLSANNFQNSIFKPKPHNVLILGWNERIYIIIDELYGYIDETSEILIIADIQNESEITQKIFQNTRVKNVNIKIINGDTTNYRILQNSNIQNYESIIILGYDNLDIQQKDAKSILTILHIRQILQNSDKNIVAEIYDEKNRVIVELSKACDYIISENIISSVMTQLSEQPKLFWIFEELFDDKGCEIYLKSISDYITDFSKEYNFYDLTQYAATKNEIAIGYRLSKFKDDVNKGYGISINPEKNVNINYNPSDILIVLGINDL